MLTSILLRFPQGVGPWLLAIVLWPSIATAQSFTHVHLRSPDPTAAGPYGLGGAHRLVRERTRKGATVALAPEPVAIIVSTRDGEPVGPGLLESRAHLHRRPVLKFPHVRSRPPGPARAVASERSSASLSTTDGHSVPGTPPVGASRRGGLPLSLPAELHGVSPAGRRWCARPAR